MSVARATIGHGSRSLLLRHLAGRSDVATAAAAAACSAQRYFSSLPATRPVMTMSRRHQPAAQLAAQPAQGHNSFHTVAPRAARRRRRFSNVRAAEIGLVNEEAVGKFADEYFPGYTAEEKEKLAEKYTERQMAALAAAEQAVDSRDLTVQGRLRDDAAVNGWTYLDDFSKVQPVVDRRQRPRPSAETKPEDQVAIDPHFMDDKTFAGDFLQWLKERLPEGAAQAAHGGGVPRAELERLVAERDEAMESFVGGGQDAAKQETFQIQRSSRELMEWYLERAPATQRDGQTRLTAAQMGESSLVGPLSRYIPGVTGEYKRMQDPEDEGLDENGEYVELKRKSGLKIQEMQRVIATKVLLVRFVATQTRLGKIQSASVVAIAGNGAGRLGLGVAKSTEFQEAVVKAKAKAVLNMRPIRRYEQRTIYGNVEAKVSGTVVQLAARPPGFGLRVPHRVFEMARAVGITDLAARIPRSRNPFNTIMATYQALMSQPDPEQIAIGRGKKLVDARKVYYGGAVL